MEGDESLSAFSKIFANTEITTYAAQISPRIANFYEQISKLFHHDSQVQIDPSIFNEKIEELFSPFVYQPSINKGPVCQPDGKTQYFRCFDCELMNEIPICEECFVENQHKDHRFIRLAKGPLYCACGNEEILKKQGFCTNHSNFKYPAPLDSQISRIFHRQIEFLLYLSILVEKSENKKNTQKRKLLSCKTFHVINIACKGSYNYQKITSTVLLDSFSKELPRISQDSIIHQIFRLQWNEKIGTKMVELFYYMFAIKRIRREILKQFLQWMSSPLFRGGNELSNIMQLYLTEGKLIARLIESNEVKPISIYHKAASLQSQVQNFLQVYCFYAVTGKSSYYLKIVQQCFSKESVCRLFNYDRIEEGANGKDAVIVLQKNYLLVVYNMVKALYSSQTGKPILEKMIRECYNWMMTVDDRRKSFSNFNAQRTFSLTLFCYLNCSLQSLNTKSLEQLHYLFTASQQFDLFTFQSQITTLFRRYCALFSYANYERYDEIAIQQSYKLNSKQKIVISIDYIFAKISLTILSRIKDIRGYSQSQMCVTEEFFVMHKYLQDQYIKVYRQQKFKAFSVGQQNQEKVQVIRSIGLFLTGEDHICLNFIEILGAIKNFLFLSENNFAEVVLANQFGQADQQQILKYYRDIAFAYQDETWKKFKQNAMKSIRNEKVIQNFIQNELQPNRQRLKMKTDLPKYSSQSNTSIASFFLSEFKPKYFTQKALNFKITPLNNMLFKTQHHNIKAIFNRFIDFMSTEIVSLEQHKPTRLSINWIVEILMEIYLGTREPQYLEIFKRIIQNQRFSTKFAEQFKFFIGLMKEGFVDRVKSVQEKDEKQEEKRKETISAKKQAKMKQMKKNQAQFLQQHPVQQQVANPNTEVCIICKQSNSSLSYLCHARYSNLLPSTILNSFEPFLLITTCGHLIHEECLTNSLDPQDNFGHKYNCFLCKQQSNLRIPFSEYNFDSWLEDIGTVLILLKEKTGYELKKNIATILMDTLSYTVFLYFLTVPKFYVNHMQAIFPSLLAILRHLSQKGEAMGQETGLTDMKKKLKYLMEGNEDYKRNLRKYGNENTENTELKDTVEICKLFLWVLKQPHSPLNLTSQFQRLKFFKIPQDIVDLQSMAGASPNCSHISSTHYICFVCGFKICPNCQDKIKQHVSIHVFSAVTLRIDNGKVGYWVPDCYVQIDTIYENYAGEEYPQEDYQNSKHGVERGTYMLKQDRYDSIVNDLLMENVEGFVEKSRAEAARQQECIVQ